MSDKVAYFNFVSVINEASARHAMRDIGVALAAGATEIYLNIASPGGRTQIGFALYNSLRSLPIKVTTHSMGFVDSAAVFVFLAGEERIATPISSFMIHRPTQDLPHAAEFGRFHLALLARELECDEEFIKDIFLQRTKLTEGEVISMLSEGRRLRPQEALTAGIVSRIELFAPPLGSHVQTIGA